MKKAQLDRIADRAYEGPADLKAMKAMLISARAADAQATYWHAGDLIWRFFLLTIGSDPQANIRLWTDDAGVLGFAWFDPRDQVFDFQAHPRSRAGAADIHDRMLCWVEDRWRLHASSDRGVKVRNPWTGACDTDARRVAFLERHGFARGGAFYHHMTRPLALPLPSAGAPAGFALRCVAGEHESAARAAAHRSAFHPSRVTDEHYLRLMRLSGYDRELDVVAIAPSGQVASFAVCWMDEVNRVGEFEPVGTHADFRRLRPGARRIARRHAAPAGARRNHGLRDVREATRNPR